MKFKDQLKRKLSKNYSKKSLRNKSIQELIGMFNEQQTNKINKRSKPNTKRSKPIKDSIERKLYVIECWNKNERFLKVGYANTSIKYRFHFDLPYRYKILAIIPFSLKNICKAEKELHTMFSEYKYNPKLKFSGYTECFDISIKNKIQEYFV